MHNDAKHIKGGTRFLRTWHPGRKVAAIIAGVGAVVAIGGGIGGYALASASTSTVSGYTQVVNVDDTSGASTQGTCLTSNQGYVWAHDTYGLQLTAVNTTGSTWRVTLEANGSFAGFADPITCNAMTSQGNLIGLYTVEVTSTTAPSPENLQHAYFGGNAGFSTILAAFFNNPSVATTYEGGDYFFSYQNGAYVQTGGNPPGVTGNPTGDIYGDVIASSGHHR